jgi:hypothetical protein
MSSRNSSPASVARNIASKPASEQPATPASDEHVSDAQSVTETSEQSSASEQPATPASEQSEQHSDAQSSAGEQPAGDAQSEQPATPASASDALATLLAGLSDEQRALLAQVQSATPASKPAKMTRQQMKRECALRLSELIEANRATLCKFDDATLIAGADSFYANYMSYAPALAALVTHTCSLDDIRDAVSSLRA